MAFEDWFSGDYGSDYTPMEGNTTPDTPGYFDNAGGTFGDWSEGNYDYQYGNPYDYGADWMHNSDTNTGSNFYGSDPLFQGGQAQQPVYQQSTNPSLNWGGAGSAVQAARARPLGPVPVQFKDSLRTYSIRELRQIQLDKALLP